MEGFTPAEEDIRRSASAQEDSARNAPPPSPRQEYIALLADLAVLLRKHPRLPVPYIGSDGVRFAVFGAGAPARVAEGCRAIPCARWAEEPHETEYGVYLTFRGEWHGISVVFVTAGETERGAAA